MDTIHTRKMGVFEQMNDFYRISNDGMITRTDGVPIEPRTMKQMCEFICQEIELFKYVTPEEIYNFSNTGELFMIHRWYLQALKISEKRKLNK